MTTVRRRLGQPPDLRPEWCRWDEVKNQGKVVWQRIRGARLRPRIDFGWLDEGSRRKRVFVDTVPTFDGSRRRFACSEHAEAGVFPSEPCTACAGDAERELQRIHAMLVTGESLQTVLLRIRSRPSPDRLVEVWLERYLKHFRSLVDVEKRSPAMLRELERWAKPEGHFGWWRGRHIDTLTNGNVEDWHEWLARRPNQRREGETIGLKTQKNVSDAFRTFLGWLEFREEIARIPTFPTIVPPEYLPQTLDLTTRAKVLEQIPWTRRGAFLAACWLLMRPREIRACDLDDYDPRRGVLAVCRAFKGPRLDDPVQHTKARASSWREVWNDELKEWIAWRLKQVTKEARLRGEIALFWCPSARNDEKRWADDPLRQEWNRACGRLGLKIPLYQGTKHSTATALAEGGIQPLVLKALGGWKDSKSVEKYAKPRATRAAIVRALPLGRAAPRRERE